MIRSRKKEFCPSCIKEHEIDIIDTEEEINFRKEELKVIQIYSYCSITNQYFQTEEQLDNNEVRVKDAYREKVGLLTSSDIIAIRKLYDVSQKDLATILDFGLVTIARYEKYQIQDRPHDDLLRRVKEDPLWFLKKIKDSKHNLSEKAFNKYMSKATKGVKDHADENLRRSIEAEYVIYNDPFENGGVELDFNRLGSIVSFIASKTRLFKVKLMKILWYIDMHSFNKRGFGMTGLVYLHLPMGAVPEAHQKIFALKDFNKETIYFDQSEGQLFLPNEAFDESLLTDEEKSIVNDVLNLLEPMSTKETIAYMHDEKAYKETNEKEVISYKYAKYIKI